MKKLIALVLALMLLCSTALAEGIDWASMTDEELHAAIAAARNELTKRDLVMGEKVVLLDSDGVQLYLTGKYDFRQWDEESIYLELEMVFINDSDENLGINIDECYVNGWDIYGSGISAIASGKKSKEGVSFNVAEADVTKYEDIEDIEFVFNIYNGDTYMTIKTFDPVTVQFNAD